MLVPKHPSHASPLWDVLALGVPLCYLYNLLPSASAPISVDTDVLAFDPTNERTKKHAIALFAMNVKQVPNCEGFKQGIVVSSIVARSRSTILAD